MMGVSHVTVLRWLRDGYIARYPDGLIDAADAERLLADFGLPRARFEAGNSAAQYRVSVEDVLAAPLPDLDAMLEALPDLDTLLPFDIAD